MAYLDHAATTPMLDEAIEAYAATAREVGNPSSLHAAGRCARRLVEESRERIAAALGARPSEGIFTSGGTASAVLAPAACLATHEGAVADLLPVDALGRVSVDTVAELLERYCDEVAVISVQ